MYKDVCDTKKVVFVTDDDMTNLLVCEQALESTYDVFTFNSAQKLFSALERKTPDIILLDVKMPQMDGYEAIKHIMADDRWKDIPVVFLTAAASDSNEELGLELGAADFIAKPFSAAVLKKRIETHVNMAELNHSLKVVAERRAAQIKELAGRVVSVIADMVESRDSDTGGHTARTLRYLEILYDKMVSLGLYADEVSSWNRRQLLLSALLHDVGKVAIPDSILNKPGKLTADEFEVMKTHAVIGRDLIRKISAPPQDAWTSYPHDEIEEQEKVFFKQAELCAGYHHEKWDGSGYPEGLIGEDIPLAGRVMAIADVYDALVSARPYKEPFSHEEAVKIIKDGSGTHFDPNLVDVFCQVSDEFERTSAEI
jgi:putative two-component system response regulator